MSEDDFAARLKEANEKNKEPSFEQTNAEESRSIGMRAGSEFMASIIAGGLVGYGLGYFLGNPALWLIIFMFAGFGWGIFRAAKLMQ